MKPLIWCEHCKHVKDFEHTGTVTVEYFEHPEYRDACTRFALQPGATLDYTFGGETEEGRGRTCVTIDADEDDPNLWNIFIVNDGRDCDGRCAQFLTFLSPGGPPNEGYSSSPTVRKASRLQDYEAERAGY